MLAYEHYTVCKEKYVLSVDINIDPWYTSADSKPAGHDVLLLYGFSHSKGIFSTNYTLLCIRVLKVCLLNGTATTYGKILDNQGAFASILLSADGSTM